MKKIKKAEPKAGKLVVKVQVQGGEIEVPVKKTVLLTDKTGRTVEGFVHRPVILDGGRDFVLSTTKWSVSERFGYQISRGEYSTMADAIEAATAAVAAADIQAIYNRMCLDSVVDPQFELEVQFEDQLEMRLLKKLEKFLKCPLYTEKQNPVIKVTGEEKVKFLRDHLKKLRLQALDSGQVPLKFIKVVDRDDS